VTKTAIERYLKSVPEAHLRIQYGPGFKEGFGAWIKHKELQCPFSSEDGTSGAVYDTVGDALRSLNEQCKTALEFGNACQEPIFDSIDEGVMKVLMDDLVQCIEVRCMINTSGISAFAACYIPDETGNPPRRVTKIHESLENAISQFTVDDANA
jgi:hypothetical protein